ncbi:MAG: peptidoglycan editing factor PgeF [Clostridia bacterium]|nr:peptidoglycan editing factor PgeF [Clostridia bacterium]
MQSKTLKINKKGDLVYITFPKLQAVNTVRHTFSTRLGGVSDGQYSSMNLSFNNGDNRQDVIKNYEIICSAVGINTENLVLTHQTHTNNVIAVDENHRGTGFSKPSFQDVDGLITDCRGVALVIQFADCTPLIFCDPVKRVIASSHSGWRGTVKQIGAVTIEKMVNDFGCKAENIIAAIGPSIGNCCYEVDEPVFDSFSKMELDMSAAFQKCRKDHWKLDLKMANKIILINSGIKEENIDVADICTCCNSHEFHSHRATAGKRGNLAAIIEIK